MELGQELHGFWPIQSHKLSGLWSKGESLDATNEEMEAAAEEAVDEAAEAVEAEITAMQTTAAVDMPEEAAETEAIDMEGRQ